jgi:hypothetical protein
MTQRRPCSPSISFTVYCGWRVSGICTVTSSRMRRVTCG